MGLGRGRTGAAEMRDVDEEAAPPRARRAFKLTAPAHVVAYGPQPAKLVAKRECNKFASDSSAPHGSAARTRQESGAEPEAACGGLRFALPKVKVISFGLASSTWVYAVLALSTFASAVNTCNPYIAFHPYAPCAVRLCIPRRYMDTYIQRVHHTVPTASGRRAHEQSDRITEATPSALLE